VCAVYIYKSAKKINRQKYFVPCRERSAFSVVKSSFSDAPNSKDKHQPRHGPRFSLITQLNLHNKANYCPKSFVQGSSRRALKYTGPKKP